MSTAEKPVSRIQLNKVSLKRGDEAFYGQKGIPSACNSFFVSAGTLALERGKWDETLIYACNVPFALLNTVSKTYERAISEHISARS